MLVLLGLLTETQGAKGRDEQCTCEGKTGEWAEEQQVHMEGQRSNTKPLHLNESRLQN